MEGYILEAGTATGRTDVTVPTLGSGYVANGVASGTYYVRVRAVRAGVTGEPSGEVIVQVP